MMNSMCKVMEEDFVPVRGVSEAHVCCVESLEAHGVAEMVHVS